MAGNSRQQTADSREFQAASGSAAAYSFRDLAVWQRAQELSLDVVRLVRGLPGDRATLVLAQQLLRSATSIAANIAEGHGRFAAGAYRNHLSIARGSANETLSWLDLMRRADLVTREDEDKIANRCDEVLRMISAQMIAFDKRSGHRHAPGARKGGG